MLAKKIDVEKTKVDLKELLLLVHDGTEVILTEGDTPLARLVPIEADADQRIPNLHPGAWMSDDFRNPLPDEFWLGEE